MRGQSKLAREAGAQHASKGEEQELPSCQGARPIWTIEPWLRIFRIASGSGVKTTMAFYALLVDAVHDLG
jgi:hypothetical protein